MNPEEYISSGILETYALGAATPAERLEVESMLRKSQEVRTALDQILQDIEAFASLHAVKPDEKLREKILANISSASQSTVVKSPKVIALNIENASSTLKSFAIAASLILVVSIAINIFQWKNTASLAQEKQRLDSGAALEKTQQLIYQQELVAAQLKLERITKDLAFLRNPMTKNVALNSVVKDHPMNAAVYVDMNTMQLAVDPMTLPATSADQKYVLWAMVDGKAVNVGDFDLENDSGLMMMKTSPQADAYAISLEQSGNVSAPAGPIYVMGKMGSSQP
ncbi:MAG: anti-sigma factor [Bacteroidia bacterium]